MKLGRVSAPPSERSVVLVISPLVSLMVNQVSLLQSVGVPAAILSGNKGVDKKYQAVGSDISEGKYIPSFLQFFGFHHYLDNRV